MRHLHGRGGLRAAGAQCLSHENARGRSRAGDSRPQTLKEAINEAMRDWVTNVSQHALHPRHGLRRASVIRSWCANFQRVIGDEARRQILEKERPPAGLADRLRRRRFERHRAFYPFLEDKSVKMVGVEAGGEGIIEQTRRAIPGRLARRAAGHALLSVAG